MSVFFFSLNLRTLWQVTYLGGHTFEWRCWKLRRSRKTAWEENNSLMDPISENYRIICQISVYQQFQTWEFELKGEHMFKVFGYTFERSLLSPSSWVAQCLLWSPLKQVDPELMTQDDSTMTLLDDVLFNFCRLSFSWHQWSLSCLGAFNTSAPLSRMLNSSRNNRSLQKDIPYEQEVELRKFHREDW